MNIVSGLIVIAFGLHFRGLLELRFSPGMGKMNTAGPGFWPSVVFGLAFSLGWAPCADRICAMLPLFCGAGSSIE